MDLAHGASFYPSATVRTATIQDMVAADVIVIAGGRGGRTAQSRPDLPLKTAQIIKEIGPQLTRARGSIGVVINPVDVLTQLMTTAAALPDVCEIGPGTMLDT